MKKITLFFVLLLTQSLFAQFTENDIRFWVGEGTKKAFLVADFKGEETIHSYAWGYRFENEDLTVEDMLNALLAAEPKLQAQIDSGYLSSLTYNHHTELPDQFGWATFDGTSLENLSMNNGVGYTDLYDGMWFGMTAMTDDIEEPSTPVAAYSSQWFSEEDIVTWFGTGTHKSLVVVDFGTDSEAGADSFVFGIRYETETITAEEALELIQTEADAFDYVMDATHVSEINWTAYSGAGEWKSYTGTNLSDWKETVVAQIALQNGQWLGLSLGSRRPFTPREEGTLANGEHHKVSFSIYPNPAVETVTLMTEQPLKKYAVYSSTGKKIQEGTETVVNVSALSSGIYIIEVWTETGRTTQKLWKK